MQGTTSPTSLSHGGAGHMGLSASRMSLLHLISAHRRRASMAGRGGGGGRLYSWRDPACLQGYQGFPSLEGEWEQGQGKEREMGVRGVLSAYQRLR